MFKKILLSSVLTATLFSSAHAASINFNSGERSSKPVSLEFPGKVYDSANTLSAIEKRAAKSDATPSEEFLLAYVEVNKLSLIHI